MRFEVVAVLVLMIFGCQANDEGHRLYNYYCSNCHMDDGMGLKGLIPPLADSDYLRNHQEKVPCIIRYGLKDSIQVNDRWYQSEMLPLSHLTDVEIANIINYINKTYGDKGDFVTPEQVKIDLENCE